MTNNMDFEIAVVGAGIAGSSFVARIAPFGESIALIDENTFPRRKPCGEGLAGQGVKLLSEIGIEVSSLPHQPLNGYQLYRGGKAFAEASNIHTLEGNYGVGIQRYYLDEAVAKLATSFPTVSAYFGSRVRRHRFRNGKYELNLADGRKISARYLVIAAGIHARPRSNGGNCEARYGYCFPCGSNAAEHLRAKVHIILADRYEIYITPVGKQEFNVAVLCSKQMVPQLHSESGQQLVVEVIKKHLHSVFVPNGISLSTGPLGNFRRSAFTQNCLFIGDACEQFDPIGGMGLSHAALSAKIAAECLQLVFKNKLTFSRAAKRYAVLRNRAARPLRGFTRLTHYTLVQKPNSVVSQFLLDSALAGYASSAIHLSNQHMLSRLSLGILTLAGV